MVSLSEQDREQLDEALWGGRIYDDVPLVVEQIVARHVAAALEQAADRVAEFDWDDNFHAGEFGEDGEDGDFIRAGYYSAIERACLLLGGQINDWRDRKPQIHN